jgi:small subunit ribosomal protein S15
MARMHSRKKGQSGSKRPIKKSNPTWIRYKPKEIELLIAKFAKEGKTSSEIGIILRDIYGVPDVKLIVGKTITKILAEKDMLKELPEDLLALMTRSIYIRKHIEINHKDMTAKRGLQLTDSKINRLIKYYKNSGKIPVEWKFDPSKLKMYTE